MTYAKLYAHCDSLNEIAIPLSLIKRETLRLTGEDDIQFVESDFDTDKCLGYMRKLGTLPAPYASHTDWRCLIFYAKDLNTCWRRFVCCKELMHLFDGTAERTNTKERFEEQLAELATLPLAEDASARIKAEHRAVWMALGVFAPLSLRNLFLSRWQSKDMTDYDVALKFRIPEAYVPALMSARFEMAIKILTADESHAVSGAS